MEEIIKPSHGPRFARRVPRRVARIFRYAGIFFLMAVIVAILVLAYAQLRLSRNQQEIAELSQQVPDEPMNVLVLGSDSREGLSPEQIKKYDPTGADSKTGKRADTIILLHLDEKRKKAILIHFPRDLRVTDGAGNPTKINGIYQDGPGAMIETVQDFTGLPIHHYVEVNFAGFNNIVDALGGVDVYFEKPINEPDSGLNVPRGCVTVEGDQALAFVRVRKIDDDFGRIARQQLFLKLMMEKVTSAGTLLNPIRLVKLVNLFATNVETDAQLTVGDMKTIAGRVRGFSADRVDMRVVPSSGAKIRGVSYVIATDSQTEALFRAINEREPLPDYGRTGISSIEPADIELTLFNGVGVDGLAKSEAEALRRRGFQVKGTGDAATFHEKTTVYHDEGFEDKAKFLAAIYGAAVKVKPENLVVETEIALVLGQDFSEGRATPPPPPSPGQASKGQKEEKPLVHACED